MATDIITFKLIVEENQKSTGDIRRVTLSKPAKYTSLESAAKDLLQADEVKFRYCDDDGDRIVLSSQYELETAIGLSNTANTVRLFVEVTKAKTAVAKEPEVPKVEEVKVVEEKKPEEVPVAAAAAAATAAAPEAEKPAPAPAPAPEPEKKKEEEKPAPAPASPFAELFRNFSQIPGVNCTHDSNGTGVVDIDFGKLFSPENGENVWAKISEALSKVAQAAANQQREEASASVAAMKPDETAGVYANVIHTMPTSVVHHGVICDGCGKRDIPGMRYKCAHCPDYDLCQDCIRRASMIHDPSHMFYPMAFPAFRGHRCQRPFPCGAFPGFAGMPRPQHQHQHRPQPQPQPVKKPEPQPEPEKKPEPQPEPEKKAEPAPAPAPEPAPKQDDVLADPKYAELHLTDEEKKLVRVLIDMGFPNVELDAYYLRANRYAIDDRLIEILARYNV